jgi:hypothetical protein
MSEGTWEFHPQPMLCQTKGEWQKETLAYALDRLRDRRRDPDPRVVAVHYSPCDEGCRHGGPTRCEAFTIDGPSDVEASWRQVDVRCLDWPHDLRPESLSVLCLRCFVERQRAD